MRNRPRAAAALARIPAPNTLRRWLAESLRRSALLRSLLRVALRKEALGRKGAVPAGGRS